MNHKRVADIGCGVGNLILHVKDQYQQAVLFGYDFSPKALEIAMKRNPEVFFEVNNIYNILKNKYNFVF